MDKKNFLDVLALAHCIAQSEMYNDALRVYEDGYQPKTSIWEMLTVAEVHGIEDVAEIVATVLTCARFGKLDDPVSCLSDLIMVLRYKTKFFNPKDTKNPAVKMLNEIYNNSLDLITTSLYNGDIPSDVSDSDKVCELIVCE